MSFRSRPTAPRDISTGRSARSRGRPGSSHPKVRCFPGLSPCAWKSNSRTSSRPATGSRPGPAWSADSPAPSSRTISAASMLPRPEPPRQHAPGAARDVDLLEPRRRRSEPRTARAQPAVSPTRSVPAARVRRPPPRTMASRRTLGFMPTPVNDRAPACGSIRKHDPGQRPHAGTPSPRCFTNGSAVDGSVSRAMPCSRQ